MANRHTLHINKLNNLKNWLEKQGYILLPTSKNPYEVLKAKKDNDTVIIYCKADSKEHLSVMDKDYSLIRRFVNESKAQTNADRIRSMTDEELAGFLKEVKEDYQWANPDYPDCEDYGEWLEWLQSEVESEE